MPKLVTILSNALSQAVASIVVGIALNSWGKFHGDFAVYPSLAHDGSERVAHSQDLIKYHSIKEFVTGKAIFIIDSYHHLERTLQDYNIRV